MDAGIPNKNSGETNKGPVNAFVTAVASQIRAIAHQNELAPQNELACQNEFAHLNEFARQKEFAHQNEIKKIGTR